MQLTGPELEILKSLWQQQPLTGKEIHQRMESLYGWSYSSTRKTLERMAQKNYVSVETQGNKKIYSALLDKVPTLAAFVKDFSERVLEINGNLPVAMFSGSQLFEQDELSELEAHLNTLQQQKNN
ncbi:BlaI/MecI/CopY family transcriptional regulator [Pseudoalteromonas spongiae]|uniref:BlaI/MecI/CopY family transcriptional regulator n=1 Tax=Pseudoalteromonas spongiae TaxID=298657 RepID=UPI000C2D27D4|nr:BlaI/MecI/CopY family transcriptional regulator [Pseudoalteromonas spongiae]